MPAPKPRIAATDALVGLWTVALTAFVIAALYFGRDLLIPLALAALLTFLLSPLVTRLERWLGRIVAVLLVVTLIFSGLGGAGWIFTRQLVDLATKLPQYKGNITEKLQAFRTPKGGTFTKLSETVEELKQELPGGSAPDAPVVTKEPGKPETAIVSPPNPLPQTVAVKMVESSKGNPFELVQTIITPLLGPLGTAALVLVLVICMLFQREDLRNRLIRLVGQGRIGATTRAMDDASDRVSRYLRMQLFINISYGVAVAIGLHFIGVPNAALWGGLGILLRFIPYIGPWVASILPTLLAFAISPGWMMPLLTLALFGVIELILNNVVEPLLYGKHTGVSSIALIVAAVFWTWLWGPLGLVLATPLTVCLVVMGRHIPRLSFLGVLLSDEEPLTPAEDCYHRLITVGDQDETELVDDYLKENSLAALYDSVLVPVISTAETDARDGRLDPEQLADVRESLRVILDDLAMRPAASDHIKEEQIEAAHRPNAAPAAACRVYCVPARAERDEFAGAMLTQLLREQSFSARNASATLSAADLLGMLDAEHSDIACISVVAPSTVIHARFLCTKLRARFPALKIIVGLWGATDRVAEATKRLQDSGADETVTSLAAALEQITTLSAAREQLVAVNAA